MSILHPFFLVLNDRAKEVLTRRYGLDGTQPETLQEIGTSLKLTRERIRQIQNYALQRLQQATLPGTTLGRTIQLVTDIVHDNGGFLAQSQITEEAMAASKGISLGDVHLALDLSGLHETTVKHTCARSWHEGYLVEAQLKKISSAIARFLRLRAERPQEVKDITFAVRQDVSLTIKSETVQSVLRARLDTMEVSKGVFALSAWRSINPKFVYDYITNILTKEERPMHFEELAARVRDLSGRNTSTHAVHNDLIRRPEFVLAGKGKYALAEWKLPSGTILDVMITLMQGRPPMYVTDIEAAVLNLRPDVRPGSVRMHLQSKFERVGRGMYTLKP